jgi:hypothetical protein
MIRAALLAALLMTGCFRGDAPCVSDDECDGDVCARDGECLPAADVHRVQVRWTVRGQPADARSCAGIAELELQLRGDDGGRGHSYTQVPCPLALFTIDKIGRRYRTVTLLGFDGAGSRIVSGEASIVDDDAGDGAAQIDLAVGFTLRISGSAH